MTDYKEKYLKYKTKYLDLKAQLGGGKSCNFAGCRCINYYPKDRTYTTYTNTKNKKVDKYINPIEYVIKEKTIEPIDYKKKLSDFFIFADEIITDKIKPNVTFKVTYSDCKCEHQYCDHGKSSTCSD